jgi:acetolactate synthase-1/2/3 large subunit
MGSRYCFTVPGESFLPLLEDLAEVGVRVVTTRHESSAAFMAAALARSTGRPQLVAVSRAPGATNASIGIYAASEDSAPLIALVGQVDRAHLGREAFQELDVVRSVGTLATLAFQLDDPADTPGVLARVARRLHAGRPGPILLSLPQDVLDVEIDTDMEPAQAGPAPRPPAIDRSSVAHVLKLLAASERGVIVAGGGVLRARATKRLVSLSEALAVPVIAAWRRADVFPNDHPNYLGMAGPWAAATVRERLVDADVAVFIGARLSETTTFDYAVPASTTRWVHVDLHPQGAHAGMSAPTEAVEADASRFLDAAWGDLRMAALDNEMRSRREARMMADREAWRAASNVGQGTWAGPGVHPGHLVQTLRAVLPDNATIALDAGNMGGWLMRGYRSRRPNTLLATASGAMGFGLPAAIAASLADPDRIAVAFCGDGGLAMTMAELETSVREGAHPIVIVLDDERYTTIAMHQSAAGHSTTGSELGSVDFAAVARAHGALGFTVSEDAAFEPALREAIASRSTSLLHVRLDRAWVSVDENPVA